jgi:hypothetical protein
VGDGCDGGRSWVWAAPGLRKMGFPRMTEEAAKQRGYLAGKTVLLTGPTAGLGAAIIDELCQLGHNKPKKARDPGGGCLGPRAQQDWIFPLTHARRQAGPRG